MTNFLSHRSFLEVVARTAIIHAVLIYNYLHLQRVQKVQSTNHHAGMLRVVLFAFMPTLVLAEWIMSASRTFFLILRSDPNKFSPEVIAQDWRRYLCALSGMRVAQTPTIEQKTELESVATNDLESGMENEPSTSTVVASQPALRLSRFQDASDLQRHEQPWKARILFSILLLVLAILQAVGSIVLWSRKVHSWPMSIDRRNFMAAICTIACSIQAIVILVCRSEWSLADSSAYSTRREESVVLTFFSEIVLASILNEVPFVVLDEVLPVSWALTLLEAFGVPGIIILTCTGFVLWFVVQAFDKQIKQRVTIDWPVVLGIPIATITLWIFIDLIVYVVQDILMLANSDFHGHWRRDTLSFFLLIC